MRREDWLTLFVGYDLPDAPEPTELDPLRIHTGMFLLWKACCLPDEEAYDFVAHDFGPMSPLE